MELNLYYSYLEYKYNNEHPYWLAAKSIPCRLWLTLVGALLLLAYGWFLLATEGNELWRKVVLAIAVVVLISWYVDMNHLHLRVRKEKSERYWDDIKQFISFLEEHNIHGSDAITTIKNRIDQRIKNLNEEQAALRENDNAFIHALPIPIAILIVTSALSNQTDMITMITSLIVPLIYLLVISGIVVIPIAFIRRVDKVEIELLQRFSDDLQGALDYEQFAPKTNKP